MDLLQDTRDKVMTMTGELVGVKSELAETTRMVRVLYDGELKRQGRSALVKGAIATAKGLPWSAAGGLVLWIAGAIPWPR